MKFKDSAKTVFLDPNGDGFDIDGEVNVILSPSLYWVKKVSIPVKSIREARGLIASLFEDTLPDDAKYNYSAYKEEDKFFIFAYDDKLIIDTLNEKGLSVSQVRNVHFAQSEFCNISGAVKINERQSIYVEDKIVVLLPCCWIKENGDIDIDGVELSKHFVTLRQYSHILNDKTYYSVIGVFFVLITVSAFEYFMISSKINNLTTLKDQVFAKASLKPTMMQNKAILAKYQNIHKRQSDIREYISVVLNLKLKEGIKIENISLNDKKINFIFSGIDKNGELAIKKRVDAKKMKYVSNYKNGYWYLEFSYE
jgi:hypothetical protein